MKQISIKVDVPDGFVLDKIETEGNNIVAFVKEKEKFKRGYVVASKHFIVPYMGVNPNEAILFNCFFRTSDYTVHLRNEIKVGCGYINEYRLATPSEAQQFFDALAKEGKRWNPDTLQIENIEKDILVPDNIGIYKHKHKLDLGLFIGFNCNSQRLGYHTHNKQYIVTSELNKYDKVQCKLTPCKRVDLKAGDTAFASIRNDYANLHNYCKIIDECIAYPLDLNIQVESWENPNVKWYKIEPIN